VTHPPADRSSPLPAARTATALPAAAVIVHDQDTDRVLLLRRSPGAAFAPGRWDLPTGKSEPGEPVTATAARELREETGLTVRPADLRPVHLVHGAYGTPAAGAPDSFLTVVFAADAWSGEPENREPHKHARLDWVPTGALPDDLVPSTATALHRYLTGGPAISLRGWEGHDLTDGPALPPPEPTPGPDSPVPAPGGPASVPDGPTTAADGPAPVPNRPAPAPDGPALGSPGTTTAPAPASAPAPTPTATAPAPTPVPHHHRTTADAYDAVATIYAALPRDDLDSPSPDRAVLAAFAELARSTGEGPVAELGCGPGPVTAHLRGLGLDVFGVDLSPAMIDLARETYPDLRFEVGSMDALDLADGTLNGIVSWYSIIHTPPQDLPAYFAEFRRVLAPGGHLLLAFFESEGEPVTPFDHKVTTAYRWPLDALAELAAQAGFAETGRLLRAPREGERFRRGHLLLHAAEQQP